MRRKVEIIGKGRIKLESFIFGASRATLIKNARKNN